MPLQLAMNDLAPPLAGLSTWWARWRRRAGRARWPVLALQPVGVAGADLARLAPLLAELGDRLGVRIVLDDPAATLVLLDVDYAGRTPTTMVRSLTAGRPALMFERPESGSPMAWREAQRELLRQLGCLPALRDRVAALQRPAAESAAPRPEASLPDSGFDPSFDSLLHADALLGESPSAEQRVFVGHVLQGLRHRNTTTVIAGYGPRAGLRIDFGNGLAQLDPLALQGLRVRREVPRCSAATMPGDAAHSLELDVFVWHLGMACGRFVLLDQGADPWHAQLENVALQRIEPYSSQPRHLAVARRLQQGPASPSELRRAARIGVSELRSFVQACLFLGLVRWVPPVPR